MATRMMSRWSRWKEYLGSAVFLERFMFGDYQPWRLKTVRYGMNFIERYNDPPSGVYALVDPRDGRVMYVGRSVDIPKRFKQHVNCRWDRNRKKAAWIAELKKLGLSPDLEIIAKCNPMEAGEIEVRMIAIYRRMGQCELNLDGGTRFIAPSKPKKPEPEFNWEDL